MDSSYENEDGYWHVADPTAVGLNDAAVRLHLELAIRTGADAVLVARESAIVCEWYSARYTPPVPAMSSTKSVTSILCGIMRDRGMLSFEDRVGVYLPDWREGRRGRVTIRQLLSQTSGLSNTIDPARSVGYATEKNLFVRALEPDAEPGTEWSYSNEGVQLLSPVMESASGEKLDGFARSELFVPLGMLRTRMNVSGGDVWTYADMETTPRDFGRLGGLMRGEGRFAGREIVSARHVGEAVSPTKLNSGYGLLWWLYDSRDGLAGFGAEGYLDTSMYVFPEYGLTVVRMQMPKASFSGERESGNYRELARRLFPVMVGKTPNTRILGILDEIRIPAGDAASPKPVQGEEPQSGSDVLERAVQDSANGRIQEVIDALVPFVRSPGASQEQMAQAFLTLSLAYLRKSDRLRAAEYLKDAREQGAENLSGWWGDNYRDLERQLGMERPAALNNEPGAEPGSPN
jgi:hypothetical protein